MKYIAIGLFILMLVANYMANALPLNNRTTGELSALYPNLFVPAGITFSIWGIIYLLLAAYCVVLFLPGYREISPNLVLWFSVSCILNALWIFAWHYERLFLSVIIMGGLLLSLILINSLIRELPLNLIKAAFGVYLGWICIATIANLTAFLVGINWNGAGLAESSWAIILIITGTLIVLFTTFKLENPFIGLAVIWAFAGIIINRHADYPPIALTASVGLISVAALTIRLFLKLW